MKIRNREIVITPELYEEILVESNHLYDFLEYNLFVYRTKKSLFLNKIDLVINVVSYDRLSLINSVINVLYRASYMNSHFKKDIEKLGFPDYYKIRNFYLK